MPIKHIFFDLGDTLLDRSISLEAFSFGSENILPDELLKNELISKWENESLKTFQNYYNKGEFHTVKRLQVESLKNLLLEYDIDLADQKLIDIVKEFWRFFIKNCKLHKDVAPTLIQLVRDGYELGLITNGDEEDVIGTLEKHNLMDIFKVKVISSAFKIYKPNPLLFERALELAKCLHNEVIYVGDSYTDLSGAKQLGLITVLIDREEKIDSMHKFEPDFRIDNLQKLYIIIQNIQKTEKKDFLNN